MDDRISDLLKIVQEEICLYHDLAKTTRHKTDLLMQGCAEAILESNRADERHCSRLRTLEMERSRLCQDLGRSFRIPRREITLMKLADYFEPSLALELRTQATLIRDAVKQLKSISQRNIKLIERSMGYSQGLLALFSNAGSSYRATGLFEPRMPVQTRFSQSA
jgi:hypothetical protein